MPVELRLFVVTTAKGQKLRKVLPDQNVDLVTVVVNVLGDTPADHTPTPVPVKHHPADRLPNLRVQVMRVAVEPEDREVPVPSRIVRHLLSIGHP
jgi:hypothetical protein